MDAQEKWPEIRHHGGAGGVTGSCHQLMASSEHSLLVDCELFQGEDAAEDTLAQLEVGFDISTLKALVITHVHIDHVGRLPYLLAAGFKGSILCSKPSALLLPLVRGCAEDWLYPQRALDRAVSGAAKKAVGAGSLRAVALGGGGRRADH